MMTRSRLLWLCVLSMLGLVGCVVVVEAPRTPTPGLSPMPASPSPPVVTPVGLPTIVGVTTQPSPTLPPTLASDTPAPTESASTTTPPSTAVRTTTPISITTFTASPPEIRPGESLTLTWSVIAQEATLWQLNPLGQLSIWYSVPLSGSLVITNTAALRNQVSFVLFATSGGTSAQAFASARITCPDTYFFVNPPSDCPASPPKWTQLVAQDFEHGQMLWSEASRMIYILYAGGARWEVRYDAWAEGMLESDPGLTPPAGLFQPVRGFGLAWRDEQALEGTRVRDRLGWGLNAEYAIGQGAFQCNSAPKYVTCYLNGPGGVVYRLKPEGSGWSVWAGP